MEIVRCLKYSLEVLYGKLCGTKLYMFLNIICESASQIRHIGLENLKNYCRSFSSSRAQKRCAPGDTTYNIRVRGKLIEEGPEGVKWELKFAYFLNERLGLDYWDWK